MLKQFRLGGSSIVPEETPGHSRIRSKAVFQDPLSGLFLRERLLAKGGEVLIMAGAGWGSVAERPGVGAGRMGG